MWKLADGVCANRYHMKLPLRWRTARQTNVSGTKPSRSIRSASRKSWPSTCNWTANVRVKSRLLERYDCLADKTADYQSCSLLYCVPQFFGRLRRVDLIISTWASNVRPSVRPYIRPSTKSFSDSDEIWYVGRGWWVMHICLRHTCMPHDPIQGQGHETFKVRNSSIFFNFQNISPTAFLMWVGKWPLILKLRNNI